MLMVLDQLLIDGKKYSGDDEDNLMEIKGEVRHSSNRKQPDQICDLIIVCNVVEAKCGLTLDRSLLKGDLIRGGVNSDACTLLTVHWHCGF